MRKLLAIVLVGWLLGLAAAVHAQEKPQKGVDVGARERHSQTRGDNDRLLMNAQRQSQKAMRMRGALSARQMTDAFLKLDVNADRVLTRSELPAELTGLRAAFTQYDHDKDHRLTYSEFCDYLDSTQ